MHVESARAPAAHLRPRPTLHAYTPGPSSSEVRGGSATFSRGHSGEDIRELQRALNAAGARPPLAEDGLFGPKTQAAVRGFQSRQGVEPSGLVDGALLDRLAHAEQGDYARRRSGSAARAPHVDQRAPEGSIPAGQLQRDDELRRRRGTERTPSAPNASNVPRTPTGPYDGRTPAPGTTSTRASAEVDPPLTNSEAQGRSAGTYAQVINQFAVGDNPRYARRNGNTYCNIFAWDVTRAMGAEIPHWIRSDGTPARPFERGAHEMNANATARWLDRHGADHGWRRVSAEEAQRHANEGHPGVAIRENPGGIGHVAVVRPGELTDRGPAIAQAGARNFNEGHARDVWRRSEPEYWVHD